MAPRQTKTPAAKEAPKQPTDKVVGSRVEKTTKKKTTPNRVAAEDTESPSSSKTLNAAADLISDPYVSTAAQEHQQAEEIASDLPPIDNVTAGEGSHYETFGKITLDVSWNQILKGASKKVPTDSDHIENMKTEAKTYRVLTNSTIIECINGERLVYFVKGGMFAGMTAEEGSGMNGKAVQVINDLLKVHKSKKPSKQNSRHQGDYEEVRRFWEEQGLQWGEHQFVIWHPQGHPYDPAVLSTACRPKRKAALAGVETFFDVTAWEHHQVSAWTKALEPKSWEEQNKMYLGLREAGALKHFDQGENGCHAGLALLINVIVGPHRDKKDVKDGWTAVYCWGEFTGADQVFPDLKYKIKLEPGDLVLAHYALLTHYVEDIQEGYRYGAVRFTRGDILRPRPEPRFPCLQESCKSRFGNLSSLKSHLRGTSKEKQKHAFTLEEIHELIACYTTPVQISVADERQEVEEEEEEEDSSSSEEELCED